MMDAQHKQKLMQCTDFEQLLDAEYGQRGTHQREKFEADAEAFCIGELLKEQRLQAGLTQKELAAQVGTRANIISRIECGYSNVSLSSIFQIFAGMGKRVAVTLL
jgi:ribosome-binding protein aMBF1 (putative translation factor)